MSLAPGMRARVAVPASLLFAALGPVKLFLLARVFRLRGARPFLAAAGAATFLLPLLPYAVEGAGSSLAARATAHLLVFWLGAPLLGLAVVRPAWRTSEADGLRVVRLARAVPFVVAGLQKSLPTVHGEFAQRARTRTPTSERRSGRSRLG